MKIISKKAFVKDLRKIDLKVLDKVKWLLLLLENISFSEALNLLQIKKIVWFRCYYRIRIWDYRLWVKYDDWILLLMRFSHRKDIYNKFP